MEVLAGEISPLERVCKVLGKPDREAFGCFFKE